MGVLSRFEDRLEHAVTGAFAKVFRSAVQPVEIASALAREVDSSAQILSRDRRLAPNNFSVELAVSDFQRLSPYGGTLESELVEMLQQHADAQGYVFAGPVSIHFACSDELSTGRFRVGSAAAAPVTTAPGQPVTDTAVRRAPVVLEVNGKLHPVEPPGLVVGRGSEAALRINDAGVSRRHAEIRVQPSGGDVVVSILDLGSTNGTTVNGHRVQQATLSDGAEIKLGDTTMVLRRPQSWVSSVV